jgi:hydroxyethylthiazole kinase
MRAPDDNIRSTAVDVLGRLRARRPRVHCITNAVAQAFTANLLLAAGAIPSMTISPEEVADFVIGADALLVNLGTLEDSRRAAIGIAVDTANEKNVPWLIDPVFIDRSPTRAVFAQALIRLRPYAVRLNCDEFTAIAGAEGTIEAISHFSCDSGTVIALTGEVDAIADGKRTVRIANGHPWMSKITAMGCASSAVVAACLAVESDPWLAVAAGQVIVGVAGEVAAEHARGPGSLAVAILDALNDLDRATLLARAKVT